MLIGLVLQEKHSWREEASNIGTVSFDGALEDLTAAARVHLDLLLISAALLVKTPDAVENLRRYRVTRPDVRVVIVYPKESQPGDPLSSCISACVSMGVYDLAPEGVPLADVLDRRGTYADAARWHLSTPQVSAKKNTYKNSTSASSPKLTIMLATGDDAINESISTTYPCRSVIALNRESLLEKVVTVKPDIIIISSMLPGEDDILEVVFQAKETTEKVIFLSGNLPENDITLVRIRELGVKVLTGEISIGAVMKTVCRLSGMEEKQLDEVEGDQEDQEGTITRLARVGTELARNIPSISVPKMRISKKTDINEKLIAVVSPLPAGKTFVSVNLSTVLAGMGYSVALVDGDARQQSIHSWLNMGEDETGLSDAVNSSDPLINAFQHQMVSNLYVFSSDPYMEKPYTVNTKGLSHLFENLQEETDIIIVDTSRNINDPLNRFIIETAASVILVADVDYSRLLRLQAELDKMEGAFDFNKFSLMISRAITCDNIDTSDAEKAAGLAADGILPEKTREVLESIKNGIPAALFCQDIKNALMDFWKKRVS